MKRFAQIIIGLFSLLVFVSSGWGWEVVVTHGHSGHIEFQDRISNVQFRGWGLDFDLDSGRYNWIHYSIPVPVGGKVRYLGLKFATGSGDIFIEEIHVYDGYRKIYTLSGLDLSGNSYKDSWYVIDMGHDFIIKSALGLSIKVGAGVEMMSHRMAIYSVGALWHN